MRFMAKKTVQEAKLKREKGPRSTWIKVVVPSVFLFLVLTLITLMALSSPLRTALDNDNIVIFILTGLLYTLIAVCRLTRRQSTLKYQPFIPAMNSLIPT